MAIRLVTFGGLNAFDDDAGDLEGLLGQHSRAALFIYLAIERRVSRESLTTIFWPESDAENARHALRQSLYQLRKAVGRDWVDSRAHELVVSDDVRVDAQEFAHALERGDAALAVQLYGGPFLDGVHLVDLKPWESWVESRRSLYARAFRKACRDLIDAKRVASDTSGAIKTAELWSARDPTDNEAQHRLIEALAEAGERAEAIRQYETYARALEADGLEPLDETKKLVERLNATLGTLPALSPAGRPERQSLSAPNAGPVVRRRPLRLATALLVLIALVGTVWGVRAWQGKHSLVPSTTTIAVLPFSVRGGEGVEYLEEGIVNLLGTALDGAGSLRPVDTRATFAAVTESGGSVRDRDQGDRVASRLGAGKFVLGDIVEAGGQVQIEAAVYDVGSQAPSSRAVVSGAADSVFGLIDRLAARLLGGLGDPAADRLSHTASLTTNSLPAFKAYLLGEEEMRAGRFERAADDYANAIALDSTFAVAHYRLALAREWAPLPGEEEAARTAARHGARLSTRDRMLLEAFRQWRVGDAAQAAGAYRTLLARYPDDVDAWFQLGEIQFHHGPLVGNTIEESEEAWRKVLAYEPRNLFAQTHLARIAAVSGRSAVLDSLLSQFKPDELREDRRLLELLILRAVARRDTATARALAQDVRRGERFAVWRVAVFLTAFAPDPAIMSMVIKDLTKDYPNAGLRADMYWFASMLDLARGRMRDAAFSLGNAVAAEEAEDAKPRRWAFEAVTEWHAATLPLPYPDSTLAQVRRRAEAARAGGAASAAFVNELTLGAPIQFEAVRQYALGTLSLRLRDTSSAAAAVAKLEHLATLGDATSLTRDLDRGLRARLAWHQGKGEDALRLLAALEMRDSQGDINVMPFVTRANERFLRGEVLVSLGRDAEALPWFASLGKGSVSEVPLLALSQLRQAEIYDRLGQHQEAARHYSGFLQLWRAADPEFRGLVDSVAQRLQKLTRSD